MVFQNLTVIVACLDSECFYLICTQYSKFSLLFKKQNMYMCTHVYTFRIYFHISGPHLEQGIKEGADGFALGFIVLVTLTLISQITYSVAKFPVERGFLLSSVRYWNRAY